MPSELVQGRTISVDLKSIEALRKALDRPSGGTIGLPAELQIAAEFGGSASLLGPTSAIAQRPAPRREFRGPRLTAEVIAARLEANAYESGEPHPLVPELVAGLVEDFEVVVRAVEATFEARPELRADLLRCLGRVPVEKGDVHFLALVSRALTLPSLRVRGAAVRALEDWGSVRAREVLRGHVDPDDRLADYVRRVLR